MWCKRNTDEDLTNVSLLEPDMLKGWRDDVKAVQTGNLARDVSKEPYFALIQLEMTRLQIVEARSLKRITLVLVFATFALVAATIGLVMVTRTLSASNF
jgi:hypothetical protein